MRTLAIIESQTDTVNQLCVEFERVGYTVYTAPTGAAGLDLIQHSPPEAVLCGTVLADMSGFEVLQHLRSAGVSFSFVFFTSAPAMDEMQRALRLGASDYLHQQMAFTEIEAALRGAVARDVWMANRIAQRELLVWMDTHDARLAERLLASVQAPIQNMRILMNGVRRRAPDDIRSMLDNVNATIGDMLDQLEILVMGISPTKADHIGLLPGLLLLLDYYRDHQVTIDFDNLGDKPTAGHAQQAVLLLMLRDLLDYLVVYDGVEQLVVQLDSQPDALACNLVVPDMLTELKDAWPLQLLNAQYRGQQLGGGLSVLFDDSNQTVIRCQLPSYSGDTAPLVLPPRPFVLPVENTPKLTDESYVPPFIDSDLPAFDTHFSQLTPREEEIFYLVAGGQTNAEIAEQLVISIRTVETHRANMMNKLDLRSKIDVIRYALKYGLISLNDL